MDRSPNKNFALLSTSETKREHQNRKTTPSNQCPPTAVSSSFSVIHQFRSYQTQNAFPIKLHNMLCNAEVDGNQDILSWMADGKCFRIHDRKAFIEHILPKECFPHPPIDIRSFVRQLNRYGFERITEKTSKYFQDSYFHKMFHRDKPLLCTLMKRVLKKERASSTRTRMLFLQQIGDGSRNNEEAPRTKSSGTTTEKKTKNENISRVNHGHDFGAVASTEDITTTNPFNGIDGSSKKLENNIFSLSKMKHPSIATSEHNHDTEGRNTMDDMHYHYASEKNKPEDEDGTESIISEEDLNAVMLPIDMNPNTSGTTTATSRSILDTGLAHRFSTGKIQNNHHPHLIYDSNLHVAMRMMSLTASVAASANVNSIGCYAMDLPVASVDEENAQNRAKHDHNHKERDTISVLGSFGNATMNTDCVRDFGHEPVSSFTYGFPTYLKGTYNQYQDTISTSVRNSEENGLSPRFLHSNEGKPATVHHPNEILLCRMQNPSSTTSAPDTTPAASGIGISSGISVDDTQLISQQRTLTMLLHAQRATRTVGDSFQQSGEELGQHPHDDEAYKAMMWPWSHMKQDLHCDMHQLYTKEHQSKVGDLKSNTRPNNNITIVNDDFPLEEEDMLHMF